MLESLITSKTRLKLLLRFFLNPGTLGYLNELANEFNESSNAVRIELNRLSKANLIKSKNDGRTKVYQANKSHPLFTEIHNLIKKNIGIDQIVNVINQLGDVKAAFITGDYAKGKDAGIIDLVIVGKINQSYLNELIFAAEQAINRKIRSLVLNENEYENLKDNLKLNKALVVWENNKEIN
ncbi:MAG: winged helix-turn-helix domain-containing protein [bacterium]